MPSPMPSSTRVTDPGAEKIVEAMNKYCMARTAEQVNDEFNALKLPCSVIMTYEMMKRNSHYQARGTFTTWHDDNKDKDLMGVNCIPFFKNNPSQIFRGGPRLRSGQRGYTLRAGLWRG